MNSIFKELGLFCWFEGLVFIFFFKRSFVVCFLNGNKHKVPRCLRLSQFQNDDALV